MGEPRRCLAAPARLRRDSGPTPARTRRVRCGRRMKVVKGRSVGKTREIHELHTESGKVMSRARDDVRPHAVCRPSFAVCCLSFAGRSPPSTVHRPPSTVHRPPSTVHRPPSLFPLPSSLFPLPSSLFPRPPSTVHRLPSTVHRPPSTVHRPPSTVHRPPSTIPRPSSTVHRPPSTVHRPPWTPLQTPQLGAVYPSAGGDGGGRGAGVIGVKTMDDAGVSGVGDGRHRLLPLLSARRFPDRPELPL